jgi:hypothetical protein
MPDPGAILDSNLSVLEACRIVPRAMVIISVATDLGLSSEDAAKLVALFEERQVEAMS